MALRITHQQLAAIARQGEMTYPYEGGGLLLGRVDGDGTKVVEEVKPFANQREIEAQHNRILITDAMYREGEAYAESKGLDLIGFFHSHPDHPARPSEFDREHALPWWSYVIVSIHQGRAGDVFSWRLRDDRSQFDQEQMANQT